MRFGSIALVAFAWVVLGACASDRTASGLNVDGGGFPKPLDGSNADSSHTGVGCAAAAKWVYLVAADRTFIRFEPDSKTLTPLGKLSCPLETTTPFSMSVDRSGTAWVLYQSGEIYNVDVTNAGCTATNYLTGQHDVRLFGMGFVSDEDGGSTESLFIAGGQGLPTSAPTATLATLDTTSLTVAPVGTVTGWPELTGTGTGELWGFFPNIAPKTVVELNKETGAVLQAFNVNAIDTSGSGTLVQAWAFAFWGGVYYIFYQGSLDASTSIWTLDPKTSDISLVSAGTGYSIVGAGVSTCAPVVLL